MTPHRLTMLLLLPVLGLLALGGAGEAPTARAATTCTHTQAFFYTTDTANLASALAAGAAGSRCTDYYVSVTPATSGLPRPGPVAAVHALGPNFHVLAELRLADTAYWAPYATTTSWFAAGVEARRQMALAGYSAALGDTWAINEVGEPSNTTMAVDVLEGNGEARKHFEDFVAGLYTGDGTAPEPGVVFAADAAQLAPDVQGYAADLRRWYADSGFWQALGGHVLAWAQETYADARAWGVAGASLDERTEHLQDYFLHGVHAAAEGDATAAAREFLTSAYAPIGNASFRYGPPDPLTGIGFGDTDIGIAGMLSFVSAQTFALRASGINRLGFAVVPSRSTTLNPGETAAVEARVGKAFADSNVDPLGACVAVGESCDADVQGAAFTEAWHDMTPPAIASSLEGTLGDQGWFTSDVTVRWTVTDPQSPITTEGCDAITVTEDTTGTTYTCTATSAGGSSASSATVRRDATAPEIHCVPTPSTLWPPNGALVAVSIDVAVTDTMSGVAGWTLTGIPASGTADFAPGTQDVAGLLRAERPGNGGDRVYALTYTALDTAGNSAACTATVGGPHDQGS